MYYFTKFSFYEIHTHYFTSMNETVKIIGTNTPAYVEYMKKNYPPDFTYQDFGKEFTAELFDPNHWAELFRASGAK